MNFEEDTRNDYFDGPDIPEPEQPKALKQPELTPDDPRYWEQPEDEFEHLRPGRGKSRILILWGAAALVCVIALWLVYTWLFVPKVLSATQYGYIDHIRSEKGYVFTTFEGVMLPYKSLMDTIRPYEGDFVFSVREDSVAAKMKRMAYSNMPMRVEYSVYRVVLPWRGNSRVVINRVDSVDERKILPPDRQPATVRESNDLK